MLVSVIIPCYNVDAFISECIDSVINQTYREIEIICIDNNSSDFTWKTLVELKGKYPYLIIDKELKIGAPAARNKGLKIAKGEWIQFLDADDLLLPTKIESQMHLINNSILHNISFITSAYIKRNVKGQEQTVICNHKISNSFTSVFTNNAGITSANLWKKDDVINIGMWSENLKSSQETDLMFRLVLEGKQLLIDNNLLTIIRERASGQISQQNPSKKWEQYILIRLKYLNSFKISNISVYELHKNKFYDFLMVSVLTLAKYNEKLAVNFYNKHIKYEWGFSPNLAITKIKYSLIKFFGLKMYLRLYRFK